ncbi:hypothetical protein GCM10022215_24140 [Nocardioides fonticola]|uniref:Uncharacterized protein n=1 Tax=Nocardioides fonticola TaxID=450363 RepID=A0ABP7XL67_9ACTN
MGKSLSELRANPPVVRRSAVERVSLRPDLVAKLQTLVNELEDLAAQRSSDPDGPAKPQRLADRTIMRRREIEADIEAIAAEMTDFEGDLTLEARRPDGEWVTWCQLHPARRAPVRNPRTGEIVTDGEAGWQADQQITLGYCNSEALIEDLGTYAVAWDGDELKPGDWGSTIVLGRPDMKRLARTVVGLYENEETDLPKLRRDLSATLRPGPGSSSPDSSASPSDGSSDGNQAGDTTTTTPMEP